MTEREAVVAFLRENAERHAREAKMFCLSPEADRLNSKASVLRRVVADIERGDHLIGRDIG